MSTAELSCYSSALTGYLSRTDPAAPLRLARAVRLAVRIDTSGELVFSQHRRIDGGDLAYRGAESWAKTCEVLALGVAAQGAVIAVGNTGSLPWSPQHGATGVPHWLVVDGREGGRWHVTDNFAALLPAGEHHPFSGWLSDERLRAALSPLGEVPPEVAARDRYALGDLVAVPSPASFRWLETGATEDSGTGAPEDEAGWLTEPDAVLDYLATRLTDDDALLAGHVEDLWAAARHQIHRLRALSPADATTAVAVTGWAELPRALRFAVDSAARGRPRPSLIAKAFAAVARTGSTLPHLEEELSK